VTTQRAFWAVLGIALAVIALVAGYLLARAAIWYQTADFFCFWNGARFLLTGRDPYDEAAWEAATGGFFPDPRGGVYVSACPGRFGYPLWTAIALVPFGAMPLEVAATLWIALAIVASAVGATLVWRAVRGPIGGLPLFMALVLFSQPFWVLLAGGQLSGLMLALAGILAWGLAYQRDTVAGAALASLVLKPQVAALIVPLTFLRALVQRRWRVLAGAILAGIVIVAVAFAVMPRWWNEWLTELGRRSQALSQFATVWGFSMDLFGTPVPGAIFLAIVVIAVVAIAQRRIFRELPFLGLVIIISLLATPYIWSYDFLVLAVPWAIVLAELQRKSAARRFLFLIGLIAVASLLPWVLYALAFTRGRETWSVVVPAMTALLLAAAIADRRRVVA
jgi:hypothetical protein